MKKRVLVREDNANDGIHTITISDSDDPTGIIWTPNNSYIDEYDLKLMDEILYYLGHLSMERNIRWTNLTLDFIKPEPTEKVIVNRFFNQGKVIVKKKEEQ